MQIAAVRDCLRSLAEPAQAAAALRFFKTGPGEYGAGDRFLGVRVPQIRTLSRQAGVLAPRALLGLLTSSWHEERLFALLNMVSQSLQGGESGQLAMRHLYLRHLRHVNNWDLVDSSAAQLLRPQRGFARMLLLRRLARSPQLWRRRVAVVATFDDIRRGAPAVTLELCERLLRDRHDLMHKACGWMLRETGKRSLPTLRRFLAKNAPRMPRMMLRYAIERLPAKERRRILAAPRLIDRGVQ
jgi:3-methyladenine DNA glycosylase AlkD